MCLDMYWQQNKGPGKRIWKHTATVTTFPLYVSDLIVLKGRLWYTNKYLISILWQPFQKEGMVNTPIRADRIQITKNNPKKTKRQKRWTKEDT